MILFDLNPPGLLWKKVFLKFYENKNGLVSSANIIIIGVKMLDVLGKSI